MNPMFLRYLLSGLLLASLVACGEGEAGSGPWRDTGLPLDAGARPDSRIRPDQAAAPDLPAAQPRMAVFDKLMSGFMKANGIKAGALGVLRGGNLVHQAGYGHIDRISTRPTPATVMMRLASVSKPLTASVIRSLVRDGKLKLDQRAFDVGQAGGGVLGLKPFPKLGDARLAEVTVKHLLRHEGGWDRGVAGDLTYDEVDIANAMGKASPPGRANTVRYILGQPLQFRPGTKDEYSNIGYLVLGLIIEKITGQDYMTALRARTLTPLGVKPGDLIPGRTFPKHRSPREPWYDDDKLVTNVFDPTGPKVRRPAGGWDHEARIAQGGLVATTRSLLGFLDRYLVSGNDIGALRSGSEGKTWKRNHTGSLAGTSALARQRGDGINYVVLFNKRPASGTSYGSLIRAEMDKLLEGGTVVWPGGK